MMLVSFCSVVFDVAGVVVARLSDVPSDDLALVRRVNKTKTLDLSASLDDQGFTFADTDFTHELEYQAETLAGLSSLIQNHSLITLSNRHGVFTGALDSLTTSGESIFASFKTLERIDA